MSDVTITAADIDTFRSLILVRLGLQFDESKADVLTDVLRRRLGQTGASVAAYLTRLNSENDCAEEEELASLALELTIPETYFFRARDQFRALRDCVLVDRMAAQASVRQLNILSAGCASGEEAYSIAMTAFDVVTDPRWSVSIRAVDINQAALKKARHARYAPWAFRETSPDQQRKWFRAEGRNHVLDESVTRAVTFQETNLATDDPTVWLPRYYDVIFCRNVMMYFSTAQAMRLVARISKALAPGGYLFLGHAETLRGLSDDFDLHETAGAFYYQRKRHTKAIAGRFEGEALGAISAVPSFAKPPRLRPAMSSSGSNSAWYAAIAQSSARVSALNTHSMSEDNVSEFEGGIDMPALLQMIDAGKFGAALAIVQTARGHDSDDIELAVLEALLLFHVGDVAMAADLCAEIQARDGLNASAHYILALCREASGAVDEAIAQYRAASYLEPNFAMPHVHTGLIACRTGRRNLARRALAQALDLLVGEDDARLVLWGGGFGRDALLDICRGALKGCEGRA